MDVNKLIHDVAQAGYEALRVIDQNNGNLHIKPWSEAPQSERNRFLMEVRIIMDSPHSSPETRHNNRVSEMTRSGWMYGINNDAIKKTNPSLLPYERLSPVRRLKNKVFQEIVRAHVEHFYETKGE